MYKFSLENIGEIRNDHNNFYTYRLTHDAYALQHGLKYEIDVLDGTRFANIKETVAYIAVDENPDGTPMIEKWKLTKHIKYSANLMKI